jgi:acetate kinase
MTAVNQKEGANVLVFNCGSSSLKYRLIHIPSERELAGGEAQRIGPKTAENARIIHRVSGKKEETIYVDMDSHEAAFLEILKLLKREKGLEVDVLGHRVVHGAGIFNENVVVTPKIIADLKRTASLAPIHNPPAVGLIEACYRLYPTLPQVAVFDTGFHSTIPSYASTYALPADIVKRLKIKKYGFHGTSHKFVSDEAAKMLGKPKDQLNAVSCHLGSGGASLCAIVNGKSVDNTMGYSPLPGLVMSTRSGDLDPGVALQLAATSGSGFAQLERTLNKKSGVLGLSGFSGDIRDVINKLHGSDKPEERLETTLQVYLWRIRKALGSYLAVVGKTDAIIFTDTIGELIPEVRMAVCAGMEAFGVKMDEAKNREAKQLPVDVATDDSRVRLLVIATNEELEIARESAKIAAA